MGRRLAGAGFLAGAAAGAAIMIPVALENYAEVDDIRNRPEQSWEQDAWHVVTDHANVVTTLIRDSNWLNDHLGINPPSEVDREASEELLFADAALTAGVLAPTLAATALLLWGKRAPFSSTVSRRYERV